VEGGGRQVDAKSGSGCWQMGAGTRVLAKWKHKGRRCWLWTGPEDWLNPWQCQGQWGEQRERPTMKQRAALKCVAYHASVTSTCMIRPLFSFLPCAAILCEGPKARGKQLSREASATFEPPPAWLSREPYQTAPKAVFLPNRSCDQNMVAWLRLWSPWRLACAKRGGAACMRASSRLQASGGRQARRGRTPGSELRLPLLRAATACESA
jgi:hypothetical protein